MSDQKRSNPPPPPFDPSKLSIKKPPGEPPPDYGEAALRWYRFGLKIIPIDPGQKRPAVKWCWSDDLSEEKIHSYWQQHPDHEVGCIVGEGMVVIDADCTEAVAALTTLAWDLGCVANQVHKTRRGEHHFFRLASGIFAKTSGHGGSPDQAIDVKTGRSIVVLPPSTGRSVFIGDAERVDNLVAASQAFIDAIFVHKGQAAPRPPEPMPEPRPNVEPSSEKVAKLTRLLAHVDAGCCREDWLKVLIVIYNVTGGSEEGFEIADNWSSTGKNYTGRKDVLTAWRSFRKDVARPLTIGTLCKMVEAKGLDWQEIVDPFDVIEEDSTQPVEPTTEAIDSCEVVETDVAHPKNPATDVAEASKGEGTILDKFSLTGMSAALEKAAVDQVPILGEVALQGQSTVWYAEPNSGKSLLAMTLTVKGIEAGNINPVKLYYLNMDDTSRGLYEKVTIAEEYNFHMIAEGYQEFSANKFIEIIRELLREEQAEGVVVILDTLKKFVDLMKKDKCSDFSADIRRFVSKGGTVIALAHTNKNKRDGKPVPCGTSDIRDDFDCAYTIDTVSRNNDTWEKVVEFENIKNRGGVALNAAYSYSTRREIDYTSLLLSVRHIDIDQLVPIKQAEQLRSDAELIQVATACIREGVNSKMLLAKAISDRSGVSRSTALGIVERYTGDDPGRHRWQAKRGAHGKLEYVLLEPAPMNGPPVTTLNNEDLF